jgi:hypothetical protein
LNAGKETLVQCCGSGMFIPDPNFFHPESEFFLSGSSNLSILDRKIDPDPQHCFIGECTHQSISQKTYSLSINDFATKVSNKT